VAGSYAISGQSAGLLRGKRISGQAGSYAISGANASLVAAWRVGAEAGAYTITGANVSLVYSAAVILPIADPGRIAEARASDRTASADIMLRTITAVENSRDATARRRERY
jgi:hypothetical protein